MKIKKYEIKHCNAGWRDFSFLKITTDEGISGISEYNECYGSPGLSIIILFTPGISSTQSDNNPS